MELTILILIYLTKKLEVRLSDTQLYNNLLIYITKLILQVGVPSFSKQRLTQMQTDKVEHNWKSLLCDALDLDKSGVLYTHLIEFVSYQQASASPSHTASSRIR